jgi:hypothetical protein
MAAMASPLNSSTFADLSVWYLFCENDLTIAPERQTEFIANIEESSGRKVSVIKLDAGHFPHVTRTDDLVRIVTTVAESL